LCDVNSSPQKKPARGPARQSPPRGSATFLGLQLFGPTVAVGLIAPFIFPSLRRATKPFAKGLVTRALILSESAKEAESRRWRKAT